MRSTSPRSRPNPASGARNVKPPAISRYFSTISFSVIFYGFIAGCKVRPTRHSDPYVRTGIRVRRIHVKQIGFRNLPQGGAQFPRTVLRAEKRAGRSLNPLRLVQAGNFAAGDPKPVGRFAAIAALPLQILQAFFNRGTHFRAQSSLREILQAQIKILREAFAVWLKCHPAAIASREFGLEEARQAIEANRNLRPRRI